MPLKILIVEDNLDSRDLLHHLLNSKGYTVSTAVDGTEGLYMARAEHPDLIITDLAMPNVTGVEMIRQLREHPETANLQVIVYSAFGSHDDRRTVTEAGAKKVFSKPIDLDAMLEFISKSFPVTNDE
jgi:CheY-like chemotaxis protein